MGCSEWNKWEKDKHVHEVIGSTGFVSEGEECHNHRFATVTGKAMPICKSHVHEVNFRTDSAEEDGHSHKFCGKTEPAIMLCNGKHVHCLKSCTEEEDGHKHKFQFATLIENPTEFKDYD